VYLESVENSALLLRVMVHLTKTLVSVSRWSWTAC